MKNNIKETGVIFSPPMAIAAIELRKTITRRLRGLEAINEAPEKWQFEWAEPRNNKWCFTDKTTLNETTLKERTFEQVVLKCPFGAPGDRIWMRETYNATAGICNDPIYRADFVKRKSPSGTWKWGWEAMRGNNSGWFHGKWTPAIHMQRKHCRFEAELVNIGIQRLQNIPPEEVELEGLVRITKDGGRTCKWGIPDFDGLPGGIGWPWGEWEKDPVLAFKKLISGIHGEEIWAQNPWVWVLTFKEVLPAAIAKAIDEKPSKTLPAYIFENDAVGIGPLVLEEMHHSDLGERVTRCTCKANGVAAKRLTQEIYGQQLNPVPVWHIQDRIVSDWFAVILEAAYQKEVAGKTIIVHHDHV